MKGHSPNKKYQYNWNNRDYRITYGKDYYKKNKEKFKDYSVKNKDKIKLRQRRNHFLREYGILPEVYDDMYIQQEGCCAICKDRHPPRGKQGMALDHDHVTGKIRSLLCPSCNLGLGKFKDDPKLLITATKYLESYVTNN